MCLGPHACIYSRFTINTRSLYIATEPISTIPRLWLLCTNKKLVEPDVNHLTRLIFAAGLLKAQQFLGCALNVNRNERAFDGLSNQKVNAFSVGVTLRQCFCEITYNNDLVKLVIKKNCLKFLYA